MRAGRISTTRTADGLQAALVAVPVVGGGLPPMRLAVRRRAMYPAFDRYTNNRVLTVADLKTPTACRNA